MIKCKFCSVYVSNLLWFSYTMLLAPPPWTLLAATLLLNSLLYIAAKCNKKHLNIKILHF